MRKSKIYQLTWQDLFRINFSSNNTSPKKPESQGRTTAFYLTNHANSFGFSQSWKISPGEIEKKEMVGYEGKLNGKKPGLEKIVE